VHFVGLFVGLGLLQLQSTTCYLQAAALHVDVAAWLVIRMSLAGFLWLGLLFTTD
jgi:hypothetical protein